MSLLKLTRVKNEITLPSGPKATVKELLTKHQNILSQQKTKHSAKMNYILIDVIDSVEGVDWGAMTEADKISFVKKMLTADRGYILTEARQLAQGNDTSFVYIHSWKTSDGVKKEQKFKIDLIDEDNQEAIIENILKDYSKEDETIIRELNRIGCFPTTPYRKRYDSYSDVIENVDIELEIENKRAKGTKYKFTLLQGKSEPILAKNALDANGLIMASHLAIWHTPEKGKPHWRKVDNTTLSSFPLPITEEIRNAIYYYNGDVDSIDVIDNPDDEDSQRKIHVNLLAQVGFFFPSGRR